MTKTLVLAAAIAATVATGAGAQGWHRDRDRDWDRDRDRDRAMDVPGRILRSFTGHDRGCRVVITRHRNWDGDMVERRRRDCD